MTTVLVIAIMLSLFVAAFLKSQMDLITHKYDQSIPSRYGWNYLFWNPLYSWRNKWKSGTPQSGEAFWGSSTFFVFLTDGWHLTQFVFNRFWQLGITLALVAHLEWGFWRFLLVYAIIGVAYSIVFELFYSKIRLR